MVADFVHMIAIIMQVPRGLGDFCLLFALMRLVQSLLKNPHIQIEPYVSLLFLI